MRRNSIAPVTVVDQDPAFTVAGIASGHLRSFVERIERLQEEIRTLQADVAEVKKEAKGSGFDPKVITHLIRLRRQDPDDRAEFEALVDVYKRALGMTT